MKVLLHSEFDGIRVIDTANKVDCDFMLFLIREELAANPKAVIKITKEDN